LSPKIAEPASAGFLLVKLIIYFGKHVRVRT
jgi:hypothetical protein